MNAIQCNPQTYFSYPIYKIHSKWNSFHLRTFLPCSFASILLFVKITYFTVVYQILMQSVYNHVYELIVGLMEGIFKKQYRYSWIFGQMPSVFDMFLFIFMNLNGLRCQDTTFIFFLEILFRKLILNYRKYSADSSTCIWFLFKHL